MRTTNRILAAVAGLLFLVGGLLAAVEIAIAYVGGHHWLVPYDEWYRHARSNSWESGGPRGIFIALTALGVVLVVLQLVRRRPVTLPMRSDTHTTYEVRRRSFERSLARRAEHVDGVTSARATVDRRSVRIHARSNRRLPGDVKAQLEHAISAGVQHLELEPQPRVRVGLRLRDGES